MTVGFVPAPSQWPPSASTTHPGPGVMSTWSSNLGTKSGPAPTLPQLTVKKLTSPGAAWNVIVVPDDESVPAFATEAVAAKAATVHTNNQRNIRASCQTDTH